MTVKPRHDFQPCVAGAFPGGLSRARYFDGMVLTQADLMREQGYWAMKRKLTNRALGQGVVWGLNLTWNAKTRCFELCPGYGLSCCGDDLIVECAQTVCEADLIDPCSADWKHLVAHHFVPCEDDKAERPSVRACLMLEYVECPEDPRPGYEDPCAPVRQGCQFGAVRETTRLRLVPPPPPPPPDPIERFCAKIEATRAALEVAGVSLPKTRLGADGLMIDMELSGVDQAGNPLSANADLALEVAASGTVTLSGLSEENLTFRATPPVGYVFTKASVDGAEMAGPGIMMGLSVSRTVSQVTTGLASNVSVEMSPLLWGGDSRAAELKLSAKGANGTAELSMQVLAVRRIPGRRDCSSHLAEGLFLKGDAGCTLRTLALTVLTGWFKSLLGQPDCPPGEQPEPEPAKVALAWLTSWLAWRVLFGIDIRQDQASAVENCLRQLFADWCAGLHYKGPRCDHNQHGIYLGCVTISTRGRIECFDEWAHRRYVLTGPLITHWAGQFGIAPIDVTATRLAGWICCLGRTRLPERPDWLAATGLVDIGTVGIGGIEAAGPVQSHDGIAVDAVRTVGALEFAGAVLRQMQVQPGLAQPAPSSYEVIVAPGLGLQMAVPSSFAARPALAKQKTQAHLAVASRIEAVPAMARKPAADLVDRLAESVAVADLRPATESALFAPMVKALDEAQVATLADLVALGPEPALERVRAALTANSDFEDALAPERAMSLVYNAALRTLSAAGEAVVKVASARAEDEPFLRADLTGISTLNALRTNVNPLLRGNGLSQAAMRTIATGAAAPVPKARR